MLTLIRDSLATFGDAAILVLCYFVWRIYHNHLPHFYREITRIREAVAYNKGRGEGPVNVGVKDWNID